MSASLLRQLEWLPKPVDFARACRELGNGDGNCGAALREIATQSLDGLQLNRLAKLIGKVRAGSRDCAPLTPFKLGLIGEGTLDLLAPALVATGARHGLLIECITGGYGQMVQDALSPDSAINRAGCDAVLLVLDHRTLMLDAVPGDAAEAEQTVDQAIELVRRVRQGLVEHGGAHVIVPTLATPVESLFGSLDRLTPGTPRHMADCFNRALVAEPRDGSFTLLDVGAIAETVGTADWFSDAQWNLAKLPFAAELAPLYADHACRLLGALKGKSRRALILDLDNTLWGGIIGDDGMEGIVIGQGNATGEAHLAVQRMALSLRARGVVLAVSSKNTDEIARRVFREHPEMLIREDHIAVFQANWNDKATNIKAIAEELSLGLDAMVFLDDNPVERALVRRMLPQVAVPELPEDPALYARTLAAAGYYEATSFSAEDRARADNYQNNARRIALGAAAGDLNAYLASLDMEIGFQPFDAIGRARIHQLANKSNQFNLTTRRYSESDIAALETDDAAFTLQVRLQDRFGDNGMISVIVCRADEAASWRIETWLMSCRVLGRGVEQAVLGHILDAARAHGIETLIGDYIPTERNALVRDHYAKLGFTEIAGGANGATRWSMPTATIVAAPPMRIANPFLAVAAE